MELFEYKVVPAPDRGEKARGAKTPADRFAHALSTLMNRLARDGWEYLRADTLPSQERTGLTRRSTVYHAVLVFRRAIGAPSEGDEAPRSPVLLTAPVQPASPLGAPERGTPDESPATKAAPKLGPKLGPASRPGA